jgi:hypothetical protein
VRALEPRGNHPSALAHALQSDFIPWAGGHAVFGATAREARSTVEERPPLSAPTAPPNPIR